MDDQSTSTALSEKQIPILFVLQAFSALLSLIGSSTIVFKILRDRIQFGSTMPYDRFVLGLSICDIITSLVWPINDLLRPEERGDFLALGNAKTCQAIGFFATLSFSTYWYTCMLSYCFLLTVLSQIRQRNYIKSCEIWMHLSVLYFPITAVMGLRRGWYGQDIKYCWISDESITWIVAGIPTVVTFFSLIMNGILIYAVVLTSLRSTVSSENYDAGLASVQKKLKREAATLMILYTVAYFVTVGPAFARNILDIYFGYDYDDAKFYPLAVVDNVLKPLQGFFNFFIYIKPTYTRFRATNPSKPLSFVLNQALFNPDVPQLSASTAISEDFANPNRALFNSEGLRHSSDSSCSSDESSKIDTNDDV